MDGAIEEEELVFEQMSPAAFRNDEELKNAVIGNTDVTDDIDDQAEEDAGSSHYSEATYGDASQMSPARDDELDDEIHCANCSNYRDNTVRAFEAATNLSKLQAQYNKMNNQYEELCKNNASASMLVEDTYNKLRDTEVHRDRLQGELDTAVSEIQRLQELNKQYLEAARLTDKHRQGADAWRNKYIQSQSILLDKAQKYDALEEKYRNSVDIVKSTLGISNENAKKLVNLQSKLEQKTNDNKVMKKNWNVVIKLISDISSQFSDQLPEGIRERLDKLSMDERLQISKPTARGAEESDDDDAETVQRLLNFDSGDSHFVAPGSSGKTKGESNFKRNEAEKTQQIVSPDSTDVHDRVSDVSRKTRGVANDRGGRVSRGGRVHSIVTRAGGRNIVDESIHENLLSRKLHRSDFEQTTSTSSDMQSAARSVMGKKTETVRQQQERQKAGLKEKIAEMKKDHNLRIAASKNSAAVCEQSKFTSSPGCSLENDMVMSDDDNENNAGDDAHESLDAAHRPIIEYDLNMPDISDADVVGSGGLHKGMPDDSSSIDADAAAAAIASPTLVDPPCSPADSAALLNAAASMQEMLSIEVTTSVTSSDAQNEKTALHSHDKLPIEIKSQSVMIEDDSSSAATILGEIEDLTNSSLTLANTSPSPSKMILHPKVVELSQERDEANALQAANSSKREQRRQESLAALGMDMSDSDDSEEEQVKRETEGAKKNDELPISIKTPFKTPPKCPQQSPLTIEKPKTAVEKISRPPIETQNQLGLSRRISKANAVPAVLSSPSDKPIRNVSLSESVQPFKSNLLDDILSGAHQTDGPKKQALKTRKAPQKGISEEFKKMNYGESMEDAEGTSQTVLRRSSRSRSRAVSPPPFFHLTSPQKNQPKTPLMKKRDSTKKITRQSGDEEEKNGVQVEREAAPSVTSVLDTDNEQSNLMISSVPNSPVDVSSSIPPISPTIIMPASDPVVCPQKQPQNMETQESEKTRESSVVNVPIHQPKLTPVIPPLDSVAASVAGATSPIHYDTSCGSDVVQPCTEHDRISNKGPMRGRFVVRGLRRGSAVGTSSAQRSDVSLSNATAALECSTSIGPVLSLEEKRRNAISSMVATQTRATTKGRKGCTSTGGGCQTSGKATFTASGSRTSAMEARMAKMSKNLQSGKLAMSGKSRLLPPVSTFVPPVDAASISKVLSNQPSQLQPQPDISVKTTALLVAPRGHVVPQNKISEAHSVKRKASMMSSVDAVAIRAKDIRMKGQSSAVPATASTMGAGNSAESRLITTVAKVCREEETIEKAMQQMDTSMLRVETIVKCVCKALMELPQSNTWHVVRANMRANVDTIDRNKVIPKAERNLFDLLMKMQDNGDSKMRALFENFFETYCRVVLRSVSSSNTTADVTRNVRCLFFALVLTERSEDDKMEEGRKVFHQILLNKSSQAVCQSLAYLLWQQDTASLVSDILRTELNDDWNGGRLISMHMNAKKDAEVLNWAIEHFANNSCKNLSTAAFRTPATLEMVQSWWETDMKTVEKAKDQPDSIVYTNTGALEVDAFYKALMLRMPVLISPQLRIDGLDRVKLLEQLDTPAFDVVDRVTANRIEDTGRVTMFIDTSSVSRAFLEAGEARVIVLKIHIAMAALTSFYTDRMYEAEQREALRVHLAHSIERVRSILHRPAADLSTCSATPENHLSMGLRAIIKWRDVVQRLTQNDLMCTPASRSAESSPAKKRPRSDDYGAADQLSQCSIDSI